VIVLVMLGSVASKIAIVAFGSFITEVIVPYICMYDDSIFLLLLLLF